MVYDGKSPVELFGEQQADHLVGEGHFGEGDFVRCRGVGFGRETVRPAGDEHQVADSGVHFSLQERSELHGAELLAMFVEKDYAIGFFEPFPHGIEFFLFLLRYGQVLCAFQGGDGFVLVGDIAADTLFKHRNALFQVGVLGFSVAEESDLHAFVFFLDGFGYLLFHEAETGGFSVHPFYFQDIKAVGQIAGFQGSGRLHPGLREAKDFFPVGCPVEGFQAKSVF